MVTDRLTERAKKVIISLPRKERLSSKIIITAIKKEEGMGNILLQNDIYNRIPKDKLINISKLIHESYSQAYTLNHVYVGTEHLLLALLKIVKSPDFDIVKKELIKINIFPGGLNITESTQTPLLDSFGESYVRRAIRNLNRNFIHRNVYDLFISALLLKNTQNVLLIGENGVGKRTLVEMLSRNIFLLNVPRGIAGYKVIDFDLISFMTGVFSKGNMESALVQLSDELKTLGKTILFIRNFQNIFFSTPSGVSVPMFYPLFKTAVSQSGSKIVAVMNSNVYEKIFSDNEQILSDYAVISVPETEERETLSVMEEEAKELSLHHDVIIPHTLIKEIYKKAKEIESGVKFPRKGVDFMDFCCTYASVGKTQIPSHYIEMVDRGIDLITKIELDIVSGKYQEAVNLRNKFRKCEEKISKEQEGMILKKHNKAVMSIKDVKDAFVAFKEEGKGESLSGDALRLSTVAEKIRKRIIGQDTAVDNVVRSLIRSELGLRAKKRPLGNFLFLGPTGVGKTELAKVLAEEYFGDRSLIRLDMSDFSEKHTVARLVGAPPGYVGYGEGGELTSKIESNPSSVVLFDEIEKAHPDVLNILLQIMEEAELTDAKGSTFDFSKSVVILTSNLGTEILHNSSIGFEQSMLTDKKVEDRLKGNLKKILKPELLNRLDEVVVFKRLGKEEQKKILNILMDEISNSLRKQSISLDLNNEIIRILLRKGYSDEFGARSLRRTVEKELLDPIASFLLKNEKRPLRILAEIKGDAIVIKNGKQRSK